MQRPTEENLYEDGYDAIRAQADYEQKRKACRRRRKLDDPELYALVKEKFLDQQWSPEQIQYRLRHENSQYSISSATISRELSERPAEAQARERLGDWEADTVAGITGGAVLATLTDPEKPFSALRPAGEEDGRGGECGDYRGTKRGDIAQHHAGQGQRVRAARGGNKSAGRRILLSAAVPALAARDKRKHQRFATRIFREASGHCPIF